jgi:hypothetical protein
MTMHAQNRPHAFTYLFICLLIGLLRDYEKDPARRWRLAVMPPLFLLWTQLHAGFVAGLMVMGLYAAGHTLQAWREKRPEWTPLLRAYALAGTLSGLATFANPYGASLHAHILKLLRSPVAKLWNEFQPPFLHSSANIWLF